MAAYRWLGSRDEALDAVQEAAARSLAAQRRYDPGRPFYPWFYTILKNLCRDRVARRRVEGRGGPPLPADEVQVPADRPDGGSAEGALLVEERSRGVDRALRRLPERHREVIELRHFQDLSYDEMAGVLGCPLGTVMSRLYRARKALRAELLSEPAFALGDPAPTPGQRRAP